LKRLLNNKNIYLAFCLVFVLTFCSCGNKKTKTDYIARVEDSYFTRQDFAAAFDTSKTAVSFKKEFLRNWVDRELLYKEAVKEDIEKDEDFQRLLTESKKELAKSFLIKKLLDSENFTVEVKELQQFYDDNKNDFKLFYDAYLINIIKFKDEDKAILFRNSAMETDWNKAALAFLNDPAKAGQDNNKLFYVHQFQSADILNIVRELSAGEISIVINSGSDEFSVVQLINKFSANDIPPLESVKVEAEKRLIAKKKQEFLQNYMKELYSKYDIEIRN